MVKSVLLVVVICSPFFTLAQIDINQLYTRCMSSYQVDYNTVQQVIINAYYTTSDPNLQCVVHCVGQSANVLDSNGRLISGFTPPPYFDYNRAQQAVGQCSQLSGASTCATGFLQWQCLIQLAGNGNGASYTGNTYGYVATQYPYYYNNGIGGGGYVPNNINPGNIGNAIQFPGNYFGG